MWPANQKETGRRLFATHTHTRTPGLLSTHTNVHTIAIGPMEGFSSWQLSDGSSRDSRQQKQQRNHDWEDTPN